MVGDYRSRNAYTIYMGENDEFLIPIIPHVIPALIRRTHEAKLNSSAEVTVWGSGRVLWGVSITFDDMAICFEFTLWILIKINGLALQLSMLSHINVGTGVDWTDNKDLAFTQLAKVVGFEGKIILMPTRPDEYS